MRLLRLLAFTCALCAVPARATGPRLEIAVPSELFVGDHAALVLTVELPFARVEPLLVTPSSQGDALEIVRGRLLSRDARAPDATPLVFDLPVLAHKPGSAVVRVRVNTFRCERSVCEPIEFEAQRTVLVRAR